MRQPIWVFSTQNPGDHPTSFSYGHARFHFASFSLSCILCDMLTHGHFYDMVTLCYTKLHECLSFSNKSITLLFFTFHHWRSTNQCGWNNLVVQQSIYSHQPREFKKWWSWSMVNSVNRPLYLKPEWVHGTWLLDKC